jgi:hypothetical protein
MSEPPIERLNYFNGQRLEAADLRLEQEFHMRIQRWLSKSLFSPGVADGFDVTPIPDPTTKKNTKVRVSPGLALDDLGRAIIQVTAVELLPQARFLCVRYAEHKDRVQEGECNVRGPNGTTAMAQWGGPERIISDAELTWRVSPPLQDTRELIIAELQLDSNCNVIRVVSGARLVAAATQVSKVFSYAVEGEKDIDVRNPKLLRFHIKGRVPNAVSLCLRALPFSSLHYTEMPSHAHGTTASATSSVSSPPDEAQATNGTGPATKIDDHGHLSGGLKVSQDHGHDVTMLANANFNFDKDKDAKGNDIVKNISLNTPYIQMANPPKSALTDVALGAGVILAVASGDFLGAGAFLASIFDNSGFTYVTLDINQLTGTKPLSVAGGGNGSTVGGSTGLLDPTVVPSPAQTLHTHPLDIVLTNPAVGEIGAYKARDGAQLVYLSNLKVSIDGSDPDVTTAAILAQVKKNDPARWPNTINSLDGGPDSLLFPLANKEGTGLIRLDLLGVPGVSFGPDEVHEIELSVDGDGNGGCVQYNLYVE